MCSLVHPFLPSAMAAARMRGDPIMDETNGRAMHCNGSSIGINVKST